MSQVPLLCRKCALFAALFFDIYLNHFGAFTSPQSHLVKSDSRHSLPISTFFPFFYFILFIHLSIFFFFLRISHFRARPTFIRFNSRDDCIPSFYEEIRFAGRAMSLRPDELVKRTRTDRRRRSYALLFRGRGHFLLLLLLRNPFELISSRNLFHPTDHITDQRCFSVTHIKVAESPHTATPSRSSQITKGIGEKTGFISQRPFLYYYRLNSV